jgi:hypothetical protein
VRTIQLSDVGKTAAVVRCAPGDPRPARQPLVGPGPRPWPCVSLALCSLASDRQSRLRLEQCHFSIYYNTRMVKAERPARAPREKKSGDIVTRDYTIHMSKRLYGEEVWTVTLSLTTILNALSTNRQDASVRLWVPCH